MSQQDKRAVLLFEDGTVFYGKSCGAEGTTAAEIAFNTGMTGYQEIITDPSYYGQMVVMAASHIGNYGVHEDEVESDGVKIKGLIVKKFAYRPSRYGTKISSLQDYLVKYNVVGIRDVDTRSVVTYIRENGAQNALISTDVENIESLKEILRNTPSMKGLELASKVSTKAIYSQGAVSSSMKVALLDFGVKKNIVRSLVNRGCHVTVFPYDTNAKTIIDGNFDGIMLSNGPGDPEPLKEVIQNIRILVHSSIPMFGICLGHQLLALSQGLRTEKMYNGHRGINHPVLNLITGKGEITSQNHGFVVNYDDAENDPSIIITHKHLNDGTLAGIALKDRNVFSVQYHPEASPGPTDSRYLFDQFVENIKAFKEQLV